MFFRVFITEWKKLRTSSIWIPVLVAPILTFLIGVMISKHGGKMTSWLSIYNATTFIYAILFLPMLVGILASLCCRNEHLTGGWKQLLALPVKRSTVYIVKLFYVLIYLALAQILVLLGVLLIGFMLFHIQTAIPWGHFAKDFIGGWVAAIPLAALQLWVATWWKSFGAPFALNIILTIPGMAVAHSHTYGPIYPWTQPMLAMLNDQHGSLLNMTNETLLTIIISGIVFLTIGLLHFTKRDFSA